MRSRTEQEAIGNRNRKEIIRTIRNLNDGQDRGEETNPKEAALEKIKILFQTHPTPNTVLGFWTILSNNFTVLSHLTLQINIQSYP